jgi:hypothetical protein
MKILKYLIVVLFVGIMVLGGRYYYYVAYASSPYDEVGIGIAGLMPAPIRAWGCAKLDERFPGNAAPPMYCH